MSYADTRRMLDLEAEVATLLARVAVLEDMVAAARQRAVTPVGVPGALDCATPAQHPSSASVDDAAMASVVEALEAGQSIRGTADMLGLDRNKVARLRRRAIAEGRLTVSSPETGQHAAAGA